MFFLLRTAFWLTLALALLPTGQSDKAQSGPQFAATDALSAAGAAVSDVGGFCDRQAEACVIGAQAASAIGQRAQAGARMVYDFVTTRVVGDGNAPAATGTVDPASLSQSSQHTLKSDDMAPVWRAPPLPRPAPQREAEPRREPRRPA